MKIHRIIQATSIIAAITSFIFVSCSSAQDKKIRKITYYNFAGEVASSKASGIFKSKTGLDKVEYFDTLGNLIRENRFDRNMNEDEIVETTFDEHNNIIEKQTFRNYFNEPRKKTYLYKYVYKEGLLVEILRYYQTFDTSGFFGRQTFTYNQRRQKIKEEYVEYNDYPENAAIIYNWKDDNRFIEDELDGEGKLVARRFRRLDDKGQQIELRMNFAPLPNDYTSFPIQHEFTYDRFGNELTRTEIVNGKPIRKKEYKYEYEGPNWNYRVLSDNGTKWTQFRKIEYY